MAGGQHDDATVKVERHGDVAVVTIDRPPVNALDRPTATLLTATLRDFADQREVRAVVLTAAGDRAFCAGADVRDSLRRYAAEDRAATNPRDQLDAGRVMRDLLFAVYDCAVPVVAAVNGPAIGAGLGLAALSDVIVAAEGARFGLTEINVGVLGGASFAIRLAGPYKARRMYYSGELVSAEELYRIGSIEAVVPRQDLLGEALGLAQLFASKSPVGMRLAKEAFTRVEHLPLKEAYRLEQDYTEKLRTYDDSGEASRAYLEKRPAEFHWR